MRDPARIWRVGRIPKHLERQLPLLLILFHRLLRMMLLLPVPLIPII